MPDLWSRRRLLMTAVAFFPAIATPVLAKALVNLSQKQVEKILGWREFENKMQSLANELATGNTDGFQAVADQGMAYLKQLDIDSAEFTRAVNDAYESGNRYWLWQRMIKARNIKGGILNIERNQLVQLHDHPGAIGMVRIISGETAVWQFDEVKQNEVHSGHITAELNCVSRRILKPGDSAVLMPKKGNIHALRALSKECRMLDFFIPPYERSLRSWYQPFADNWFNQDRIFCLKVAQEEFFMA